MVNIIHISTDFAHPISSRLFTTISIVAISTTALHVLKSSGYNRK